VYKGTEKWRVPLPRVPKPKSAIKIKIIIKKFPRPTDKIKLEQIQQEKMKYQKYNFFPLFPFSCFMLLPFVSLFPS